MMNELFTLLYWREPSWLALIFLPIVLILINRWQHHTQWSKLADASLQPWLSINQRTSKQRYSTLLLALAWLCFVIALAGPRLVEWLPPEQHAKPSSLIIVFDLSASMNADDVYPSRKAQAIQWMKQALNSKPKSLKIGLVLFAGHAFSLMPPTLDENVINHFIKQLDELSLPTLGNDLSAALILAQQQFKPSDTEQHIVILSDGDLSEQEQQRAQETLTHKLTQLSVHFIGFGGHQAVKIPKPTGGFILFNERPVQSRLHSTWLTQMGRLNHVSYQPYHQTRKQILKNTLQLKPTRLNQSAQQQVIWQELFPYALLLAIFFFVTSLWRINKRGLFQYLLTSFVLTALISHSPNSSANNDDIQSAANNALRTGQFKKAHTLFSKMNSVKGYFGEGIACYRQADFQCASRAFSKAAWQADNKYIKANAVFNLANSYFFLGDYAQASVLFKDAENLGFNKEKAQKNLAFSNAIQQSVLQRVKDIKEIFRRAKWRAAASGRPSPTLNSIVSAQNNLAVSTQDKTQNFILRQAIKQQINQQLGIKSDGNSSATQWIKTEHIANQSTAQLLKRLLEMELAIPSSLKEPQPIKGKQKW